jgi:hypothetical protein
MSASWVFWARRNRPCMTKEFSNLSHRRDAFCFSHSEKGTEDYTLMELWTFVMSLL